MISAGCDDGRKQISSKRIIASEKYEAWLTALAELQANLFIWVGFWAWCYLGGDSGKVLLFVL